MTLVALATLHGGASRDDLIARLLPAYQDLLALCKDKGTAAVQILEPSLCLSGTGTLRGATEEAYAALAKTAAAGPRRLDLHLVTCYDDLGNNYPWVVRLPVQIVSLDFCGVPGSVPGCRTMELVREHGFPEDKVLGAGVVDGRSVWSSFETAGEGEGRGGSLCFDLRLILTSGAGWV